MVGKSPFQEPEDFLADDRFIDWVQSDGRAYAAFWTQWRQQFPLLEDQFEQARELATQLQFKSADRSSQQAWQQLESQLSALPAKPSGRWLRTWRVAAAVALLLMLSWSLWPSTHSFQTAYGKIKTIELPDQTIVTLQANSRLWWEGDWAEGGTRKVYLDGEAFFAVTPAKEQHELPFEVVAQPLRVKVVGTEFNLVNRPTRQQVVLVEGKVEVAAEGQELVQLAPNEQYRWYPEQKEGKVQTVNVESFTDWQQYRWRFTGETLGEVAQRIEDNFGKKVIATRPQILDRQLRGSAPSEKVEILVQGIATSLQLEARIQGNQIIFSDPSFSPFD